MDWQNPLNGLHFQNHFVTDDQVDLVSTVKFQPLVQDRQRDLTFERQPAKVQLMAQALLIRRFQQSRPELAMHFNRSSDDAARSRVSLICVFSVSLCLCASVVSNFIVLLCACDSYNFTSALIVAAALM